MFIGVGDGAPVVACFESALGRVDDQLIVSVLDVPLRRELDQPVQVALLVLRVQTALVKRVQVVADVHEFGALEHLRKTACLHISAHEPAHPVIRHHRRRKYLQLAARLQHR